MSLEDNRLSAEDVDFIDQLIDDYLLFRGFLTTKRCFLKEREEDKSKSYQASKIAHQLFQFIMNSELEGFLELWGHLITSYFSKLDDGMSSTVEYLDLSLKRLYLTQTIKNNKKDKSIQFLDSLGSELLGKKEWASWFSLPFSKQPSSDPTFKVYFSKSWEEKLNISVVNFLSTVFNGLEKPKMLNFNTERKARMIMLKEMESLKSEVLKLREKVESLNQELESHKSNKIQGRTPTHNKQLQQQQQQQQQPQQPQQQQQPSSSVETSPMTVNRSGVKTPKKMEPESKILVFTKQETIQASSPVQCIRFNPNFSALGCATEGGQVHTWHYEGTNRDTNTINGNVPVTALEWTRPEYGEKLLLGFNDGKVKLMNLNSQDGASINTNHKKVVQIRTPPSYSNLFAVASIIGDTFRSGALHIYDLVSLQVVANRIEPSLLNSISYNSPGTLLACGYQDGFIRLYDTRVSKFVQKWKAHRNGVAGIAFGPDQYSIYSVGIKEKIKTWSASQFGQNIKTYAYAGVWRTTTTADVAVDKDDRFFLTSGRENVGIVYHVDSVRPVQNLGNHTKPVVSIDWDPIHNIIATSSLDNSISLHYLKN